MHRIGARTFALLWLLSCLPVQPVSAQAETSRVTASLTAIAAGDNTAQRRQAIIAQLRALGVDPVIEPFGEGRTGGENIVVTLKGSESRTIVIGAHYDRVSVGRGAVDNGAACAALIELAAAFKAAPPQRLTLQVVFFDREENGLMGSRAFFSGRRRVDYAVNLDVFAYGDSIFATASRPNGMLLKSLRMAGDAIGLPVRDVPRSSFPASDHITMMAAGVETLGVALVDMSDIDGILAIGAAGLKAGQGPRILRIIHTSDDTLAEVRADQVVRGIAVVERLIRSVDSEL
jgi:Zn-dependent M28 family amino/carboxypeptidase